MNKTDEKTRLTFSIWGMGIFNLAFLTWAALWKCGMPFIGDGSMRTINLLPFNQNTTWELQFNVAVFIPLGFYFSAVRAKFSVVKPIFLTFLTSLIFETLQFVLAIGYSDITDLLMNTLGGVMGVAAFVILAKLFGGNVYKATLVIGILITLLELYFTVSFILWGQLNLGFMRLRL